MSQPDMDLIHLLIADLHAALQIEKEKNRIMRDALAAIVDSNNTAWQASCAANALAAAAEKDKEMP